MASGGAFTFELESEYKPSETAGETRLFVTPIQRTGARQSMGSARRLLLAAVLAFAIAADARTDATLSTLTLSPDTNSLISTRDDSTTTGTSSSTTAIGSAASATHKVTRAPDANKVTEAPETEPPATTAPSTTAPPTTSSKSDAASASDNDEQDTTDAPSSASATVSPGSTSDRSNLDSESQKDAASASTSKSTTATVDTLNSSGDGLSSGTSSGIATTLPIVFGALACVGAIVMAVTFKKKRNANGADSEGNRPSSDCEYTSGADFTPDNRALSIVHEDSASLAAKAGPHSSIDVRASAAIADFTGTGSSVCSSPFSTSRGKARVSSPVQNGYSSSEANMEFQDTGLRHDGGSNVMLTFEEVPTDSSHAAPQVQL
ncbi:hypothetical protein P3T76_014763 [Phytophthora citrophthora]|uniref:Uncharacterized protein n=1 Tax=Phytophthora citrophthora TaxID=4793 RepID=A0AAD9G170_9STRA|nr:hypothetical protein P3T76_014763 [Phytophthora citrophthora]